MEPLSAILALCAGNSPVTGEFPSQRPVSRSFDAIFGLRLNKWLSKQSRRRWLDTPSRSLWCHFYYIGPWDKWQTVWNMLFKLIYRIDCESISTENAQTSSAWWRHDTEILSALVTICEHNEPVTGWSITRVQKFSSDVCQNKLLKKKSSRGQFDTPWRHYN